jgi:hypothetical protein
MTKIALASIYSFASIEQMQATSEDIFHIFQAVLALLFRELTSSREDIIIQNIILVNNSS